MWACPLLHSVEQFNLYAFARQDHAAQSGSKGRLGREQDVLEKRARQIEQMRSGGPGLDVGKLSRRKSRESEDRIVELMLDQRSSACSSWGPTKTPRLEATKQWCRGRARSSPFYQCV